MAFSPAELRKIKDAFNAYAQSSPNPDAPVLSADRFYSAREIAQAVESETGIGATLLRTMEHAVRSGQATIDGIVRSFTRPPAPPKP